MADKIKLGDTVRSAIEVEIWGDIDAEANDFPMLAKYFKDGSLYLPSTLGDSKQLRAELTDMAKVFLATAESRTAEKYEKTSARLAFTMLARLSSAISRHEKTIRDHRDQTSRQRDPARTTAQKKEFSRTLKAYRAWLASEGLPDRAPERLLNRVLARHQRDRLHEWIMELQESFGSKVILGARHFD